MGQDTLQQGIALFGGELFAVIQPDGDMFWVQNNRGCKDWAADRAASDFIDTGNQLAPLRLKVAFIVICWQLFHRT